MSISCPRAHWHFLIRSMSLSTKCEIVATLLGKDRSISMHSPSCCRSLCRFRVIARYKAKRMPNFCCDKSLTLERPLRQVLYTVGGAGAVEGSATVVTGLPL